MSGSLAHPSGQPTVPVPGSQAQVCAKVWCLAQGSHLNEDTSCRSRDSNPQPWVTSGFKSNALSIRHDRYYKEKGIYSFSVSP